MERVSGGTPVHHHHHHHHHHQPAVEAPQVPQPGGGGMPVDGSLTANPAWESALGASAVPLPPGGMAQQLQEMRSMLVQLNQRVAELEELRAEMEIAQLHQQLSAVANPAAAAAAPAAGGTKIFQVGPVPLEGYDNTKLNDPNHRTVKYVFGRVASNYPLDSVKDKASAQALLERMKPDMIAAGLTIKGIQGDKILVNTPVGDEWVDVVRGAGSGHPGWWWGSEGKAVPGSTPGPEQLPVVGGPAPANPAPAPAAGGELTTVPITDEMKGAPIDTSSKEAAIKSAAAWVKQTHPEFFDKGDDRPTALKMMTLVIGALRAHGFDAYRVVNYADRPVGDAGRYGKDALVLDGHTWDVYGGWGDPGASNPQALDDGPWDRNRAKGARE